MKNVVCKVKKPTKRLEGIAKTIFPEQETICIIDGNQLNQLIYKFAIKKIKNYMILIDVIEQLKLKKMSLPKDELQKQLKQLDKVEVENLILKYSNTSDKKEKEKINPLLNYLLLYYKAFIADNGIAISESILSRITTQKELEYTIYLLNSIKDKRGITDYKQARRLVEESLETYEKIIKVETYNQKPKIKVKQKS